MRLLTKENRKVLPALYSQDGKASGDVIVHVKYFDPSGSWTWYATEGEPILDETGEEIDFKFFGLVDGFEKEFGYFTLNELAHVKDGCKGMRALPIERDMYFTPKPLIQVVPDAF